MNKVLVVGVSSLVGTHIALRLRENHLVTGSFAAHRPPLDGIEFIRLPLRRDYDWGALLERLHPDTVFYCAAERDEAVCQEQPLNALAINAEIPTTLAQTTSKLGIRLVYFSSAKVYSGEKGDYAEDEPVGPLSYYGQTKVRAEELMAGSENVFILRLGTLYGLGPVPARSLLNRLLDQISSGEPLPLIHDEFRSFQAAGWVAEACEALLAAQPSQAGLYNLPSAPPETHYSFTVKLAMCLGLSPASLQPVPGSGFDTGGPRGTNTSLRGTLFQNTFRIHPETTIKSLKRLTEALRQGSF